MLFYVCFFMVFRKLSAEMKLTDIQELKIENQTYMLEVGIILLLFYPLSGGFFKRKLFISDTKASQCRSGVERQKTRFHF